MCSNDIRWIFFYSFFDIRWCFSNIFLPIWRELLILTKFHLLILQAHSFLSFKFNPFAAMQRRFFYSYSNELLIDFIYWFFYQKFFSRNSVYLIIFLKENEIYFLSLDMKITYKISLIIYALSLVDSFHVLWFDFLFCLSLHSSHTFHSCEWMLMKWKRKRKNQNACIVIIFSYSPVASISIILAGEE